MQTTETLYEHEREYIQERGKPMPSLNHGAIQMQLGAALMRPDYTVISELSLELGEWHGTPDICVYSQLHLDLYDDVTRMTDPPLIAVEIPSASQSQQEMVDKIQDMLRAGVKSCWLVQPTIRAVTVFWNDREQKTFTEDTITDPVTTDISIEIDDVFPA